MATIKQRVHRFNGTDYDTIHYETSSSCVLLSNGNYLSSYESRLTSTESIANGGTGQTTGPKAIYALTNACSALTSSDLASGDYFPLYDVSATTGKKVTLQNLADYIGDNSSEMKEIKWLMINTGDELTYDSKTWVVVHKDNSNFYLYLMLKDIYSTTQFGSSTTYNGSTISTAAGNFESSLGSDFKSKLVSVTCKSVTRKVFVPTYSHMFDTSSNYDSTTFEQMHFSYFPTDTNASTTRVGYYNGTATIWWTSSAYSSSYVWGVTTDGSDNRYGPSSTRGFRPFVCLNYNA